MSLSCDCGFDYDWFYSIEDNERPACAEGKCSGLYDSLTELGFCLSADYGFITQAMDEYRDEYCKPINQTGKHEK